MTWNTGRSALFMLSRLWRLLASLQLAVMLLAVLALVLAIATILEAQEGREAAQWHVYGSRWFIGLLGLLGLNILAAAAIRFPWKRRQTGFVITHVGLLVLLFGAVQTFVGGIEGEIALREGERADSMLVRQR